MSAHDSAPKPSARFYCWCLAVLALLVSGQIVWRGMVPQTYSAMDTAVLYDFGWRAYCGLRPHADYFSSLGPYMSVFMGTAFQLFGPELNALPYMNAVMFPLLLGTSWALLFRRISFFWAFWISLLVAVTMVAPYALRCDKFDTTYAMLYNRHSYAWFMLFCALLLCPARGMERSPQLRNITCAVAGVLLSVLFFLKVSYGIAAGGLAVVVYAAEARRWMSVTWFCIGAALTAFLFLAYIRFDIVGMYSDLSETARAKAIYFDFHYDDYKSTFVELIFWFFACAIISVLGCAALLLKPDCGFTRLDAGTELGICVLMMLVCTYVVFTNSIWGFVADFPVLILLSVLMCVRFMDRAGASEAAPAEPSVSWARISLPFTMMYLLSAFFSISYIATVTAYTVRDFTSLTDCLGFSHPVLRNLKVDTHFATWPIVPLTENGLAMVEKHHLAGERFLVIDFSSWLHFAVRAKPIGGSPFMDYAANVTDTVHPPEKKYFADAPYILFSKGCRSPPTIQALDKCFRPCMDKYYVIIDETEDWQLLRRKEDNVP